MKILSSNKRKYKKIKKLEISRAIRAIKETS
jgi:hypothetical protein